MADLVDLQDAYGAAREATANAASALDAIAISVDIPTQMLAASRATESLAAWTAEDPGRILASAAALPDLLYEGYRLPGPVEQAAQQFCPELAAPAPRCGDRQGNPQIAL